MIISHFHADHIAGLRDFSRAALIAAASFGGAAREGEVVAPGGTQRVEWAEDSVYLTGWAEVVFDGEWLREFE